MKGSYDDFFKVAKEVTESRKAVTSDRGTRKKPSDIIKKSIKKNISKNRLSKKQRSIALNKKINRVVGGMLVLCSLLFLFLSYIVFPHFWQSNVNSAMSYIQRIDVNLNSKLLAKGQELKEKKSQMKVNNAAESSSSSNTSMKKKEPIENEEVQEKFSHLKKLDERRQELDLRETELVQLERELHKQKDEIEVRIQKLKQIREQISSVLKERVNIDEERIVKLVAFYSNMKPIKSAKILSEINEDLAVEIFGRMKKKNAAAILNLLNSEKARALSEKYAGFRR